MVVAFIFVFTLLRTKAKAATKNYRMTSDALISKYGINRAARMSVAYDSLKAAGLNQPFLRLAMSQVMQETGVFSAHTEAANNDNNYSGIMFINNPDIQKNANQGSPFPANESRSAHYAKFETPTDWAIDFVRILSKYPNYPIRAINPVDFVERLKANHYFSGNLALYTKNVTYFFNYLSSIGL